MTEVFLLAAVVVVGLNGVGIGTVEVALGVLRLRRRAAPLPRRFYLGVGDPGVRRRPTAVPTV